MAFSPTQRAQIYQYLGYPALALDATLETKIGEVEGLGSDAIASVAVLLTQIVAVDAVFASTGSSTATRGALKKADETEFYDVLVGASVSIGAADYGPLLVSRLAARLGLDVGDLPSDYFATSAKVTPGISTGCPPERFTW